VLAPAALAALPSTRAIPDRDVFYVAHPVGSMQNFSFPVRRRPGEGGSASSFSTLQPLNLSTLFEILNAWDVAMFYVL
jgi:hypothetical protein